MVAAAVFAMTADGVGAQVVRDAPQDTLVEVVDSSDVQGMARRAQSAFERRRIRLLPLARASYGGSCDERVGRFCSWYDEGDWHPEPEDPRIAETREALVDSLDGLFRRSPGDGWILGQRVWYRSEAGRWDDALRTARACGEAQAWWCAALEGFALHGLGRFDDSLRAFQRALGLMDPEEARRWRVPRWPVDGRMRGVLDDAPPDSLDAVLTRMWALADPMYLVAGNDRLTAHYARWTLSEIRRRARNPFQISWGSDMTQLTVRHGWEMGWEREWSRDVFSRDHVVGHKHPEGRDFMPPGGAVEAPAVATDEDLVADRRRPRSLYAPAYAHVLLPARGQIAVLPRGDQMAVVATHFLPPDTTAELGHVHPRPWLDPGDQADLPDEAGLFLLAVDGSIAASRRVRGTTEAALLVQAPAGGYVVSAEAWSPSLRRAGRHRAGVTRDTIPQDIATISDLLLLRGGGTDPGSLEAALDRVLPAAVIRRGDALGVMFEVAGLGWRPEVLAFELSVQRTGGGVLRRAGEFLGLVRRDRPVSLRWEEQAPDGPQEHLRWLTLDLPDVDPGEYEIRLGLRLSGRSALTTTTRFIVEP
jgi:hypothetical protein